MLSKRSWIAPAVVGIALFGGLAACTQERGLHVPSDAKMMAEGGNKISYRAGSDGMVYIFDQTSDKLIYSGQVQKGQMVTLNRDESRITVDQAVVSEKTMATDHHYKIFFAADPTTVNKTTIERTETRMEKKNSD